MAIQLSTKRCFEAMLLTELRVGRIRRLFCILLEKAISTKFPYLHITKARVYNIV